MNNLKRIIILVVFFLGYAGSMIYKDMKRIEDTQKENPTVSSVRKEKGIPVYARTIRSEEFVKSTLISGFVKRDRTVKATVTPKVMKLLSTGLRASFEYGGKLYVGQIKNIAKSSSVLSGLFPVYVEFQNIPANIIDQLVVIKVDYQVIQNSVVLKRESVSLRKKKPFVFEINKENKLIKREIKIKDENDDYFLVDFGIQAGDRIVTSDLRYLKTNDFVYISNEQ